MLNHFFLRHSMQNRPSGQVKSSPARAKNTLSHSPTGCVTREHTGTQSLNTHCCRRSCHPSPSFTGAHIALLRRSKSSKSLSLLQVHHAHLLDHHTGSNHNTQARSLILISVLIHTRAPLPTLLFRYQHQFFVVKSSPQSPRFPLLIASFIFRLSRLPPPSHSHSQKNHLSIYLNRRPKAYLSRFPTRPGHWCRHDQLLQTSLST